MSWTDDEFDLALRDLRDEELPAGAAEAVRARVMGRVQRRRVFRAWWGWAGAAAVVGGLVMVMVFGGRWGTEVGRPGVVARRVVQEPGAVERPAAVERPRAVSSEVQRTVSDRHPLPYGRGSYYGRGSSRGDGSKARKGGVPRGYQVEPTSQPGLVEIVTADRSIKILWDLNTEGDSR